MKKHYFNSVSGGDRPHRPPYGSATVVDGLRAELNVNLDNFLIIMNINCLNYNLPYKNN